MSDDENEDTTYQVVFDDEPDKKYPYLPLRDGKAKAKYPNNDTYVGEFRDGKKHGHGEYTFASGAKYTGEYVANKKEGFGTFVAPDKGKYTGHWVNDKREGEGTYVYPNGDSYTGQWKNGAKHGPGCYTYANIDSTISGTWSNGQVVDGNWSAHDGSQYIGSFLGNQPAGEGLYAFSNGNFAAGKFADQKFVIDTFKAPHPNEKPPAVQAADQFKKACRAIDKAVSKSDHSNKMHVITPKFLGVPNFRQVTSKVFGCGQASSAGLKQALEFFGEAGVSKVAWVNLRDDPVVYVNGTPFSPRDRRDLDAFMKLPGLDTKMLSELEHRLAENIKFAVKRKGGLHDYYEEVYNDETKENENVGKTIAVKDAAEVKTITGLYEQLVEDDAPVEYKRVPLTEESRPPSAADFDALADVIRSVEEGGLVFNCVDGGAKATLAMAVATLMLGAGGEGGAEEEEAADEDGGEEGEAKPKQKAQEKVEYNPQDPDYAMGQYEAIMKLVAALNGSDPEEERKLKAEAEAKAKEQDEEKKKTAEDGAGKGDEETKEETEEAAPADEGAADEGEGEAAPAGDAAPAPWIKVGDIVKEQVDQCIDAVSAVVNLRTSILDLKKECEEHTDANLRAVITRKAANQLERYYHLILFAAYLKDVKDNNLTEIVPKAAPIGGEGEGDEEEAGEPETRVLRFSVWCDTHKDLLEPLGTYAAGALKAFDWK